MLTNNITITPPIFRGQAIVKNAHLVYEEQLKWLYSEFKTKTLLNLTWKLFLRVSSLKMSAFFFLKICLEDAQKNNLQIDIALFAYLV